MLVGLSGTQIDAAARLWVHERHVGGVALFSRNLANASQTLRLTQDLKALASASLPLWVALDQEGGSVLRVREGASALPGNMTLGATRSRRLAYLAGRAVASDLFRQGFNMNLAPVLDVNSNPDNPVIGVRSFGEEPDLVSDLGRYFILGQQSLGMSAVAKHFPGHGDTQADSHFAMPRVDADLKRLMRLEFAPFRSAIAWDLDAIMTAHIALPLITGDPTLPATLSHKLLTELLREKLGHHGVVMTDGLEMQGIAARYGVGRAAVMAVLAGADMPMVLWSEEARDGVYSALRGAASSGEISAERLDLSVARILKLKATRNLFAPESQKTPSGSITPPQENSNHRALTEAISRRGITLVRDQKKLVPLGPVPSRRVLAIVPPGPIAQRLEREKYVQVLLMGLTPTREERRAIVARGRQLTSHAEVLVGAAVNRYHLEVIRNIAQSATSLPLLLISLASPYLLELVPEANGYLCSYSSLESPQKALAAALLGEAPITGRLPVSLPGLYPAGHGIMLDVPAQRAAGTRR